MGNWGKYLFALAMLWWGVTNAAAHNHAVSADQENDLRAAIVLNLVRFISWPEDILTDEFNICVLGEGSEYDAFKKLQGREVHGLKSNIIQAVVKDLPAQNCQILYLGDKVHSEEFLKTYLDKSVLTVGTSENFLRKGGGIFLERSDRRIQFSINQSKLTGANIIPSSKILKLATEVR